MQVRTPKLALSTSIRAGEFTIGFVGIVLGLTVQLGLGAFVMGCGLFVGQLVLLIRRDLTRSPNELERT